jgi:Domain of unknown function (DUF4124)
MRFATPVLTVLLALALPVTAARAELFRCTGPDGKTIFTDSKHTCPGAEPSEPAGVVHRAETPESHDAADPAGVAPAALSREPGTPDADSEAAQWKQKKRDAESAIEQIQERRAWMKPYVGHCNRGSWVTTRDDAGIQQVVNCSVLKREFNALETQEAAARDYLTNGLPEECRRAGCLPGWLR